LTNWRAGQAQRSLVDAYVSAVTLDGAYCNALLLAHWSVRRKSKPCQFSSVASLCMRLNAQAMVTELCDLSETQSAFAVLFISLSC